jgi:hypothetical protein
MVWIFSWYNRMKYIQAGLRLISIICLEWTACADATIRNRGTGFAYKKCIVMSLTFFLNYKPTHFLINTEHSDEARKVVTVSLTKSWVD